MNKERRRNMAMKKCLRNFYQFMTIELLKENGMTPETIVPKGEIVKLKAQLILALEEQLKMLLT